jgi:glycosyltransferase involved in cell wall biosynthesis
MAKISYRAHNIESEIWRRSALTSSGLKKAYQQNLSNRIENFEKKWLNRYDLLIPITERDLKRLTQMGNRKPALVIPSGIDMETTATDLAKSEYPSLFHIGSLDWFPNQEGLLWFLDNCWEKVLQKMPDLRLYIAGRKAPGWLVARFGVSNVVFVGEVENAIDFMKSKAFMLVPLLSGSGMRVKIVEGMALGKPVISTSIGAEGIDVTDGHNILIADHPEDFVRAIEMLVTNRPEAERIGTNAKQFMRDHFDNRDITAKLAAFYEKHLK